MSAPGATPGVEVKAGGRVWTILELLRWTTDHFADRGIETSRLDTEVLLAHALGVERIRLYIDYDKPVNEAERDVFRELVRRRGRERIPVAQLVGTREFWSLSLRITPDVLVPRPETETLVAVGLDLLPKGDAPVRVLDVGTGSGAVALAPAHERPRAVITATDISQEALKLAQENAERVGMADRIRCLAGAGLTPVLGESFDLVVSNPPYIAESERGELPPELAHEPAVALFAGVDGLAVLGELASGVSGVLAPGAGIALEVGRGQAPAVADRLRAAGLADVAVHRDAAGIPRVVAARRPA
jgi:release factor glutamine methyltransferase